MSGATPKHCNFIMQALIHPKLCIIVGRRFFHRLEKQTLVPGWPSANPDWRCSRAVGGTFWRASEPSEHVRLAKSKDLGEDSFIFLAELADMPSHCHLEDWDKCLWSGGLGWRYNSSLIGGCAPIKGELYSLNRTGGLQLSGYSLWQIYFIYFESMKDLERHQSD